MSWTRTLGHRTLRVLGDTPACFQELGPVSPDGTQAISKNGKQLNLVDLNTGKKQPLLSVTSGIENGSWSPDGRWIAASSGWRIVIIDAKNPSRRRKLGSSGVDGRLIWSPDSKRLLFAKQEFRCFLMDDYESLAFVDIETGRQHSIPGAHCQVTSSAVGWVDPEVVR